MSSITKTLPLVLLLLASHSVFVQAAEDQRSDPLSQYVAAPDPSFAWTVRRRGELGQGVYAELILTSQTWRGVAWKHQLLVIKPAACRADEHHALLFIAGGSWKQRLEQPPGDEKLPSEAQLFGSLAEQLQTPVAVLLQVPHQPLFDGKYEDAIIAYTFDQFFETGDPTWPLLLPMVKSAVRGMDAVQQFAGRTWSLDLKTFTVSGASKRGWTTWLTGAVDARATALVPMVIDVLNMERHLDYQRQTWGNYSEQIRDYTERGLEERLKTDRGRRLLKIVDPYSYRQRLTQPKLIMIGTNDRYWPLDALKLYWNDLPGEKYVLYVPNNGHGLRDFNRVIGSLNAMHHHAAHGQPLPRLSWQFTESPEHGNLTLTVRSDIQPSQMRFWIAMSSNRDFRQAHWRSLVAKADGDGRFQHRLAAPGTGYAALFGEAVFENEGMPYFLSTNVQIIGAAVEGARTGGR